MCLFLPSTGQDRLSHFGDRDRGQDFLEEVPYRTHLLQMITIFDLACNVTLKAYAIKANKEEIKKESL